MMLKRDEIYEALEARYSPPAWVLFYEVADAAGFGFSRHADAVAMSIWPSRGLEIHGIEIKHSRSDWLRELKNPRKAEAVSAYCDYWFLAVDDDKVAVPEEMPPTWGLLVRKGRSFRLAKKPSKMEPKSLDRSFVAVLLRRAHEMATNAPNIRRKVEAAREEQNRRLEEQIKVRVGNAEFRVAEAERAVKDFEKASGLSIRGWDAGNVGAAVKEFMNTPREKLDDAADRLEQAASELSRLSKEASEKASLLRTPAPCKVVGSKPM